MSDQPTHHLKTDGLLECGAPGGEGVPVTWAANDVTCTACVKKLDDAAIKRMEARE